MQAVMWTAVGMVPREAPSATGDAHDVAAVWGPMLVKARREALLSPRCGIDSVRPVRAALHVNAPCFLVCAVSA